MYMYILQGLQVHWVQNTNVLQFLCIVLLLAHEGEECSGISILTVLKLLSCLIHFCPEGVQLAHLVLPV